MHMYFIQCSHDRECIVRHNIHFRTAFRIPEFPVVCLNYLKYLKVWVVRDETNSPPYYRYPICAKCKLQCVHESNIANLGTTALLIH